MRPQAYPIVAVDASRDKKALVTGPSPKAVEVRVDSNRVVRVFRSLLEDH